MKISNSFNCGAKQYINNLSEITSIERSDGGKKILVSESNPPNSSNLSHPFGIDIVFNLLHWAKAYSLISLMVDGSVILSKLEHSSKHLYPIIVTPSGMSIEVRALQALNAKPPICLMVDKRLPRITVTSSGMSIEVRALQALNA